MTMTESLVFSTAAYEYLRDGICAVDGMTKGAVKRKRFPDGELYQRVDSEVYDRDVILVGGTISEADTLELYDLASALVHYGARRLTLAIPFFGYSTMERRSRQGEVVTAKTRARLLSSIPLASMGNRVVLIDLHTDGITYYFEGNMRPVHFYANALIREAISDVGGADFVLGCTDAGRAKWVESLAHDLGVAVGYVYKRRTEADTTEVTGVSAHVSGAKVVIYDDMIRTGSSLVGAARAYIDHGATSVSAVCTHGLFPGTSLADIRASGVIDLVVCTDTHPRAAQLADDFLEVRSVAPMLTAMLGGSQ